MGLLLCPEGKQTGLCWTSGGSAFQGPVSLLENTLSLEFPDFNPPAPSSLAPRRNHRQKGSWGEHISVQAGCLDKSRPLHLLGQSYREPAVSRLHKCKDIPWKGEGFCRNRYYLIHLKTWESLSSVLCCHHSSTGFTWKFKKGEGPFSNMFLCFLHRLYPLWQQCNYRILLLISMWWSSFENVVGSKV